MEKTGEIVKVENKPRVVPISWDDLDDTPAQPVKLCRIEDPTCEACQ